MMLSRRRSSHVGTMCRFFGPVSIALAVLALSCCAGLSRATVFVGAGGADGPTCGASVSHPCQTLAYAVHNRAPVANGTFAILSAGGALSCENVTIRSTLTIRAEPVGSTARFDCAGTATRAFSVAADGGDVLLSGLSFWNGRAERGGCVAITSARVIRVENSTFFNCTATDGDGGAVLVSNAEQVAVENSAFLHCRAAGRNSGSGGAMAVLSAGAVSLQNATFQSCEAECYPANATDGDHSSCFRGLTGGGGLFVETAARLIVEAVSVSACAAHNASGGGILAVNVPSILVSSSQFVNSSAMSTTTETSALVCPGIGGGGVAIVNATVAHFRSSAWSRCSASGALGGGGVGFTVRQNGTILLESCLWEHTHAAYGGDGAFSAAGPGSGGAAHVRFCEGCTAGAAVRIYGNTVVHNSSAKQNGGAIAIDFDEMADSCDISIEDQGLWTDMAAGNVGGSLSVLYGRAASDCTAAVTGSHTFNQSTSQSTGGAFSLYYASESSGCTFEIEGEHAFKNTWASNGYGGALDVLYMWQARRNSVAVRGNTTFSDTKCSSSGGAICVLSTNLLDEFTFLIDGNVSFERAFSVSNGGTVALFFSSGISNSTAVVAGTTRFRNSLSGGDGGAIWLSSTTAAENLTFAIVDEVSFEDTSAPYGKGGAVAIDTGSTLSNSLLLIRDAVRFVGVRAASSGGAVVAAFNGNAVRSLFLVLGSPVFVDTQAGAGQSTDAASGGAIAVMGNVYTFDFIVAVDGEATFVNTSATGRGGAVAAEFDGLAEAVDVRVVGAPSFVRTSSQWDGGSVSVAFQVDTANDNNVTISGARFYNTSALQADSDGGAVYVLCSLDVAPSSFADCHQLWQRSCTCTVQNTSVTEAFAGSRGGAFALISGDAHLANTSVIAARAGQSGGGLFLGGSAQLSIADSSFRGCQAPSASALWSTSTAFVEATRVWVDTDAVTSRMEASEPVDAVTELRARSARPARHSTRFGRGTKHSHGCTATRLADARQCYTESALAVRSAYGRGRHGHRIPVRHRPRHTRVASAPHSRVHNSRIARIVPLNGTASTIGSLWRTRAKSRLHPGRPNTLSTVGADGLADSQSNLGESSTVVDLGAMAWITMQNVSVACNPGSAMIREVVSSNLFAVPWSTTDSQCCETVLWRASCARCESGKYSLQRGAFRSSPNIPASIECPAFSPALYGLVGQIDPVVCLDEPFGSLAGGGSSIAALPGYWGSIASASSVSFFQCPHGYCCTGPGPCYPFNTCAGNRTGILCGACAEGLSQLYTGTGCRPDEDCRDAGMFAGALAVGLAVALWCLFGQSERPTATVSIVVYFYQILPLLIVPLGTQETWEHDVAALFNLRVPGGRSDDASSGLCPVRGLTAVGKVWLHWVVPSFAFAWLCVVFALQHISAKLRARQLQFGTAWLTLAMLAYATALESVFALLRCETVLGSSRLFIDANIACYQGWQIPLFFVALALYIFPLALILWQRSIARSRGNDSAARRILEAPYAKRTRYWGALLLLRRLVLVTVYSFTSDVFARAASLAVLCVVMLCWHIKAQPYVQSRANVFDTFALGLLACVAVLNVRNASYVSAGVVPTGPPSETSERVSIAQGVFACAPLAIACVLELLIYLGRCTSVFREKSTKSVGERGAARRGTGVMSVPFIESDDGSEVGFPGGL